MTDTEILDELVKIASYPTDCDWGDERWRLAVETTDGLWRGLIQAMDKRRIRPNNAVHLAPAAAGSCDDNDTEPQAQVTADR